MNGNGDLKPSLSVETNTSEGGGDVSGIQMNGVSVQADVKQEGYESEDSAMLESPLSDKNPSEITS